MSKKEFQTYTKNSIDSKLAGIKIGALADVSIVSPISTNYLHYNVETSTWENANISGLEVSNFAVSAISTSIPATGSVDTKVTTEKSVADALATKANSADVYNKTEIDNKFLYKVSVELADEE